MSLVVCCPCGNPLECDNLELLITLECPHCKQELTLEFEDSDKRRCRAVLTVMEGPHWVGERFLTPVGTPLAVGTATDSWMALDGDGVSEKHCEIRLSPRGSLIVEDQGSEGGTWIDKARIARGRLADRQSFRVGQFRFRLDFQLTDGTAAAPADAEEIDDQTRHLPQLGKVREDLTTGIWLTRNRYILARWQLTLFAWLTGAYHWSHLWLDGRWDAWYTSAAAGVIVFIIFADLGRRIALVKPIVNYLALGALLMLTATDGFWRIPIASVAALLMILSLTSMIVRTPSSKESIVSIILGIASVTTMANQSIPRTLEALKKYTESLDLNFQWPF